MASKGFQQRLTSSMRKARIDMRRLAAMSGVSYEMIRRYCGGAAVPRTDDTYMRISTALAIDPMWLKDGGAETDGTTKVSLFSITDPTIRAGATSRELIGAPPGFTGFAVRMTVVLGDGFQLGDIVFVRPVEAQLPPVEARVLIEVKDRKPKYLFRRVQYAAMSAADPFAMTFHSYDPKLPAVIEQKQARVIGIAEYVFTKLS